MGALRSALWFAGGVSLSVAVRGAIDRAIAHGDSGMAAILLMIPVACLGLAGIWEAHERRTWQTRPCGPPALIRVVGKPVLAGVILGWVLSHQWPAWTLG